jgi:hypothetical protein
MKRLLLLAALLSLSRTPHSLAHPDRPDVTDFMSPELVQILSPEALAILQGTRLVLGGPDRGLAEHDPDLIRLGDQHPNVANHEAFHILSYHTPGMVNGAFPGDGTGGAAIDFLVRLAANYGEARPEAMAQFSTGMETYPMALQVVGWDPSRLPAAMLPWYAPWFVPEVFGQPLTQ